MKTVKFTKLHEDAIIPNYAHAGDAGMDLYSVEDITIPSMEWRKVGTGLKMELPENTEGQVRTKSGMAFNYGLFVLNTPGTVDENYRGEVGVILFNLNKTDYEVKKGQKIAQLVINEICYCDTAEVEEMSETDRGEGGFGSTGLGNNKK